MLRRLKDAPFPEPVARIPRIGLPMAFIRLLTQRNRANKTIPPECAPLLFPFL